MQDICNWIPLPNVLKQSVKVPELRFGSSSQDIMNYLLLEIQSK